MKVMFTLAAVLALAALSGCSQSDAKQHNATLAGQGVSVAFSVGTVAPLNSFEWGVAPLQTEIRRQAMLTQVQVLKGEVSPQAAQRTHDKLQTALSLVGKALAACAQDSKTGKCTHDQKAADQLVKQAQESMP